MLWRRQVSGKEDKDKQKTNPCAVILRQKLSYITVFLCWGGIGKFLSSVVVVVSIYTCLCTAHWGHLVILRYKGREEKWTVPGTRIVQLNASGIKKVTHESVAGGEKPNQTFTKQWFVNFFTRVYYIRHFRVVRMGFGSSSSKKVINGMQEEQEVVFSGRRYTRETVSVRLI